MGLKVVGAGLGRTGTHSLKVALEQLLGGPCYHMFEVMQHPDDIAQWQLAAEGGTPDWKLLFERYDAAVDWPAAAFWRELADVFPDAKVLLSMRPSDEWWRSADRTIWAVSRMTPPPDPVIQAQLRMIQTLLPARFTPRWSEEGPSKEAYERHNAEVIASVPADRLIVWHPGDGWGPLCEGLGLPEPADSFPHLNTTDEFRMMTSLDAPQGG
jgi:hypothetical protein